MGYRFDNAYTTRIGDDGKEEIMANFVAEIVKETRYVDGIRTSSVLTIEGEQMPRIPEGEKPPAERKPIKLPPIEVTAENFSGLTWILPNWGIQAVVMPGSGIKDDLRTAIQLRSRPTLETVYQHIGWADVDGQQVYLHAGGSISKNGNKNNVSVKLSPELERYNLDNEEPVEAGIRATLRLLDLTKPEIMWPLIAATFAPLFGEVDFAIHVTGRTGTFKSELMSLAQSHYGEEMDARHLPGSWSSTANALEAQAFYAKNAAFVIDDFVPQGTSWQVRAYQTNADKIIRAQGNQAGRARLTDTSTLQTTMFPRGIIMSTGEDTPEGHSVRARMLIMEISPGDITTQNLSAAQGLRHLYTATTAGLIQYLAQFEGHGEQLIEERVRTLRDQLKEIGHSRTPSMLARLIATAEFFIEWTVGLKVTTPTQAKKMRAEALQAIIAAGKQQKFFLENQNPTDLFIETIRHVLSSGLGHLRTINGGVPKNAELVGWFEDSQQDEMPLYKPKGPTIGWIRWDVNELYIDVTIGYNVIKKHAGAQLTLTKQTLLKRLKDDALLVRTDEARERNTLRITADSHPRTVIALAANTTLDTKETPDGTE